MLFRSLVLSRLDNANSLLININVRISIDFNESRIVRPVLFQMQENMIMCLLCLTTTLVTCS